MLDNSSSSTEIAPKLETGHDVANEMARLYQRALSGEISARDADHLARVLKRLHKRVPLDAFAAKIEKIGRSVK
ncbi:hypothetical protein FYJ77_10070 [Schaalia hyovaginalis]|nr:hypothetical protein [Schaalia hyovaginalis]